MLFPSYMKKTFAAGVALLSVASAKKVVSPLNDCEALNDYASQAPWYGESRGERFCMGELLRAGAIPKKIEFMSQAGKNIKHRTTVALRVTYTNDDYSEMGDWSTNDGKYHSEVAWNPDEAQIDWAWGKDTGDKNGWVNEVVVYTTDGGKACGGTDDVNRCTTNKGTDKLQIASGTLLAISGAWGQDGLELIKFWMLWNEDVRNNEVEDIKFTPSLDSLTKGDQRNMNITQRTLNIAHCQNTMDTNVTFAVKNTYQYTETTTVETSHTNTWKAGYSFTWGAELDVSPVKGKFEHKLEFGWEGSWTNKEGKSKTESETKEFGLSAVPVRPNKAVKVTSYVLYGQLDLAWTAYRKINLKNKGSVRVPIGGVYKATRWSESWTSVEDEPLTSIEEVVSGKNEYVVPAADKDKITKLPPKNYNQDGPPVVKNGMRKMKFLA